MTLSKIWTQVAGFISHKDNHYAKHISLTELNIGINKINETLKHENKISITHVTT